MNDYDYPVVLDFNMPQSHITYNYNNKINYRHNEFNPNELDDFDKYQANFRYPNDEIFGINYSRANNSRYRGKFRPHVRFNTFY